MMGCPFKSLVSFSRSWLGNTGLAIVAEHYSRTGHLPRMTICGELPAWWSALILQWAGKLSILGQLRSVSKLLAFQGCSADSEDDKTMLIDGESDVSRRRPAHSHNGQYLRLHAHLGKKALHYPEIRGPQMGVRSVVVEYGVFGAPRFSVQRSQNPLKIGISTVFGDVWIFGDLWTENRGAPKRHIQPRRI